MSNKKKKNNKRSKSAIVTKVKQASNVKTVDPKHVAESLTKPSGADTEAKTTIATAEDPKSAPVAIEQEIDSVAVDSNKCKRIWEVDFVRGLMILFVVWDHFMWDVNSIGTKVYQTGLFQWLYKLSVSYYAGSLRAVTHDVFVTMFVLTSQLQLQQKQR